MALKEDSYVLLNDGNKMPVIGFGTYASQGVPKNLAEEGVKVALESGYRHIDCALIYGNEVEVGRAIREKIADGTVKREDVFYTSKLWSTFHAPDQVRPALEKSLKDLQLDYIDLYIIHSPIELKVECHIYLNQGKLLKYLKSQEIVLVGYSVLGSSRDEKWIDPNSPVLLEDPALKEIAERLGKTTAQVAMRYLLQRGIVVLAKSYTPARIRQNLQVFDFQLSEEDIMALDGLNRDMRYIKTPQWEDHPKYPFHDEY